MLFALLAVPAVPWSILFIIPLLCWKITHIFAADLLTFFQKHLMSSATLFCCRKSVVLIFRIWHETGSSLFSQAVVRYAEFLMADFPTHSPLLPVALSKVTIRYDTRCYFNLRSKANMSQLNLPHGTDN